MNADIAVVEGEMGLFAAFFFDNNDEERCNTATAVAAANGNEKPLSQMDGKARKVGKHSGRKSGDRPRPARLYHSSEGEEKETFES
jgi:hypothetical protein